MCNSFMNVAKKFVKSTKLFDTIKSTIAFNNTQTVRYLYTMIDNLIKLLDNQQNVFEINKKANNQDYFILASSNASALPPSLTPQPRFLL